MDQNSLPVFRSRFGKKGKLQMPPDGDVRHYKIKDDFFLPQTGNPKKILCLQLIEYDKDKSTEVRVGYYIIGKKPRMKGRWVWGQSAAIMPLEDFRALVHEAEKKGWI